MLLSTYFPHKIPGKKENLYKLFTKIVYTHEHSIHNIHSIYKISVEEWINHHFTWDNNSESYENTGLY